MPFVVNARDQLLSYSAASLRHYSAADAGPLLEGTDSHETFWGDGRVDVTLAGAGGDDIYHLYSAKNRAVEEADAGIDSVVTWMSYALPDHIENLTVTGDGRYAFGNGLDNILTGGAGRQTFDGGAGDDVLIGGGGADLFAVAQGDGSDLIADFGADDTVRLDGYGFTSFTEIAARLGQDGDDAVLHLGGGEILVFADARVEDLTADQFALEIDRGDFVLTFADDFDALDLWDGAAGTWESNYWWGAENGTTLPNGELQWYIDSDYGPTRSVDPFGIDDGILTITAARAPQEIQPLIDGYDYTSGMLTSYRSFAQTYGYFEIRADMPEGKGLWPAFWLLPADGSWPPELDVVELIGQKPNELMHTVHSNATGSQASEGFKAAVADSAGFHDFGVLWGPQEIVWTYDGVEMARTATPEDMHGPMYMVVNLAVGGIAGAPAQGLAEPAEMKIDHVRVYAVEQALPPPAAGDQTIIGGSRDETLTGGDGDDLIKGRSGDDLLLGGRGDDTLFGGFGTDTLLGGDGSDTVAYAYSQSAWTVDLAAGTAGYAGVVETLVSIENAITGHADDTLRGDGGANALSGGAGRDRLEGRGGNDLLDGGTGADSFVFTRLDAAGGDGDDSIAGFEAGKDRLAFRDLVDADGDGDLDLDDLLSSVSSVSDGGAGGDVAVGFTNGASITFLGSGTGNIDALTDLVNDAANQIATS